MKTIFISTLLMLFTINISFADNATYKKPVRNGAGMHIKLSSTDKTIVAVSSNQRVTLRNEGKDLYKVVTKGNTTQLISKLDNSVVLTTKRVYIKKNRAWLNILYEPEGVAGISVTLRDRPGFEHSIKPTKFFDDVRKGQEKKLKKAEKKLEKVKAKIGLDKIEATAKLKAVQLEAKIDLEVAISNPDFDIAESTEVSKTINSSTEQAVSKATEKAVQEATKDTVMSIAQEATLAAAVEAVEEAQASFGDFITAIRDFATNEGQQNLGDNYTNFNNGPSDLGLETNHAYLQTDKLVGGELRDFRIFNSKRHGELSNTILEGNIDNVVDFTKNELGVDLDQSVLDTLESLAKEDGYVRITTGVGVMRWSDGALDHDTLGVVAKVHDVYIDAAGEAVASMEEHFDPVTGESIDFEVTKTEPSTTESQ